MLIRSNGQHRLTLGLLISWIHDDYHIPIWRSIMESAAKQDCNLILFAGGTPIISPEARGQGSAIYDLAGKDKIDGLIILSASIHHNMKAGKLIRFCRKYDSIPVIAVGNSIEGIPSVFIDNAGGIYGIVKHLIEIHGYTRYAYVAGPSGNEESLLRFQGFTRALKDYNIPLNTQWIIQGDFSYRNSRIIIEKYARDKTPDFQAVVCANDAMAIGVIDFLKQQGYNIPKEFAVTGFDDIPAARYLNPPLTSVRQPLKELGEKAVELLLAKINRQFVPEKTMLPAPYCIRQSCGCLSYSINLVNIQSGASTAVQNKETEIPKPGLVEAIMSNLELSAEKRKVISAWLQELIATIDALLEHKVKVNSVIHTLSDTLLEKTAEEADREFWLELLDHTRHCLLKASPYNKHQELIRTLFQKMNIHFSEIIFRFHTYKKLVFWDQEIDFNAIHYQIMSIFDIPTLIEHLSNEIPKLKIYYCYIAEYQGNVAEQDDTCFRLPPVSRVTLVFRDNAVMYMEEQEREFPTMEIIPDHLLPTQRFVLVLMPLLFNRINFGYIVFQLSDCNPAIFESLQCTISNSIVGAHNVEELKRTKSLAESASRIKSEFLANMSHEIRTPLNSILGFTDLLLEEFKYPGITEKLEIVNKAGKNLVNIINDVLDFSKIEAGKIEMHEEAFSLEQLFIHLKNMFHIKAQSKQLSFQSAIAKNVPEFIMGDEQRINQILTNLLGNALKFTEHGTVTLSCSCTKQEIMIAVSDTGIGIPADKIEHIFSDFSQVDTSTTRKYGGTGLGLAISLRLVQRMGGNITVISEEGKGSTFTLTLPLKPAQIVISIKAALPEDGTINSQPSQVNTPFHILVAEDEEMNRNLIGAILSRMNVQCHYVQNGAEALEQLKSRTFDLLLLDMQMPIMDGVAVIHYLRTVPVLKDLYVIAVTAYALKGDGQKCLNMGCNDYLPKPIDKNLLRAKIAALMQKGTVPEAQSAQQPNNASTTESSEKNRTLTRQERLEAVIGGLKNSQRIFDEDLIKELADDLITLAEDPVLIKINKKLYNMAENYEIDGIAGIVKELEEYSFKGE